MISVVSATFLWIFPAVSLRLGSCFENFSSFNYFFMDFSGSFAVVRELFSDFSGFNHFFPEFFQLLGWIGELF